MKLKSIIIDSFRVYQGRQEFNFALPNNEIANLIVIYAPNGFGKTSFFDAVEWAVTGEIARISQNSILKSEAKSERGFILKNKQSNKEFGTVIFNDVQGGYFERRTKPKRGRMLNDYNEGIYQSIPGIYHKIKESDYSQTHILQHDKIDSFLSTTSPKGRYEALSLFWDSKKESEVHKKIILTIESAKKHQEKIDAEKVRLKNELDSLQVIYHHLRLIEELINKHNDYKIFEPITISISEEISSKEISQILNLCISQLGILEGKQTDILKRKAKIEILSAGLVDFRQKEMNYNTMNNELRDLILLNERFVFRDSLNAQIKLVTESHSKSINDKARYTDIYNDLPAFLEKKKQLTNLEEENVKLQQNISANTLLLAVLNQNEEGLYSSIAHIENDVQQLSQSNVRIEAEYKTLQVLKRNREKLIEKTNTLNAIIQKRNERKTHLFNSRIRFKQYLDQSDKELLNNEDLLKESEYTLLFYATKDRHRELESAVKIQEALEREYRSKLETSTQIEKLISIGKEVINKIKDPICPLCNKQYTDVDDLITHIEAGLNESRNLQDIQNQLNETKRKVSQLDEHFAREKTKLLDALNSSINNYNTGIVDEETSNERNYRLIKKWNEQLALLHSQYNIINSFFTEMDWPIETMSEADVVLAQRKLHEKLENQQKESLKFKEDLTRTKENQSIVSYMLLQETNSVQLNNSKQLEIKSEKRFDELNRFFTEMSTSSQYQEVLLIKLNQTAADIADIESKLNLLNFELINYNKLLEEKDENTINERVVILKAEIAVLERDMNQYNENVYAVFESVSVELDLNNLNVEFQKSNKNEDYVKECVHNLTNIIENFKYIEKFSEFIDKTTKYANVLEELAAIATKTKDIEDLLNISKEHIAEKINEAFNFELINEIYGRIDPHPDLSFVEFEPSFSKTSELELNIFARGNSEQISPILYLSSAQLNILSLSIFLARALQRTPQLGLETIFMDDPIQHLDSINILSFIDLLRTIIADSNKQIIISTHSENFYQLLKRKIDSDYYKSKFIELEAYGKIKV